MEVGEKLKFGKADPFRAELKRKVDGYFQQTGLRPRDCPRMYFKTGVILSLHALAYALLIFQAATWWQALPLALLLGLTTVGIGFNIQHDGSHRAYSRHPWVNKCMALTLDFIGGSSYIWHWKHDIFHHTYSNINGLDADIDVGSLGRFSPHQRRRPFHRWQHYYLWPLYGFLAVKWLLYDDFRDAFTGRIGKHPIPRPKGREWVFFFGGKIIFFTLAFALPLMLHPAWVVASVYGIVAAITGIVLSMVFQVAHVVEEAQFPAPRSESDSIENAWAVHQVETTVDFSRNNPLVVWLVGGLNFQIEHHLFPRISHVHYPALSPIVKETCLEFGVQYSEHKSFAAGLASHFRWLRRMGAAVPS